MSSKTRVYQPIDTRSGEHVLLDARASHHLIHVLRIKPGDTITLFNGEGLVCEACIKQIMKKQVQVEVQHCMKEDVKPCLTLTLAQGIARGDKMDFIIQKAVELGVNKIVPLFTERCTVKLDKDREAKRLAHWQAIVIGACEQSGRNTLPQIVSAMTLADYVTSEKVDCGILLSPSASVKLSACALGETRSISLIIGPEGGLSQAEINLAVKEKYIAVQLGPRILRTETAGIVALTVLQYQYGDL
ncbi:MAG TPA: 16S rRNA (uracil(1498)-N(3))-methyltransferase [Gammaproteobacteria bacterium]|jgi:16S rRNA (uracil1498-N3)-methyltransferase|nr:16S rRNA (uracil(1498)-N(3))-methyltransferase [Gammaproteobacteria bacterium]